MVKNGFTLAISDNDQAVSRQLKFPNDAGKTRKIEIWVCAGGNPRNMNLKF
jgi:hypothetical protein